MTDRELMQQALEALELHATQYPHMQKGYTVDAISALRTALEQKKNQDLTNLLCRVHRDGGHYIAEHGLQKAIEDADIKISKLNAMSDAQQQAEPVAKVTSATGDPAIHFCHRFAILMECMLMSNDINLDKYWDEAHTLMGEYHTARDKWMEEQGQPYVSGFGKD